MPKLADLPKYMFTFANLTSRDADGGGLLFGTLEDSGNLSIDDDIILEIARSEYVEKLLGLPYMLLPVNINTGRRWGRVTPQSALLAQTLFTTSAAVYIEQELKTSPFWVVHSPDKIVRWTGLEAYAKCQHVHKHVKGCEACTSVLLDQDLNTCPLMDVHNQNAYDAPDIDEYRDATHNWKTTVGRFVAVSPALTVPAFLNPVGPQNCRECDEHSFVSVYDNSERRSKASKKAHNNKQFLNEACTQCAVHRTCNQSKWCSGPYGKTEEELQQRVLESCSNSCYKTFTDHQLLYLLRNSGDCDRRLERCKIYGTLRIADFGGKEGPQIAYAQVATSARNGGVLLRQTLDFKVAKKWINAYYEDVVDVPKNAKISTSEKAVLFELLNWRDSPTHGGGWHKTSYAVQGLREKVSGKIHVDYRVNRGDGRLRWTLDCGTLKHIHECYRTFSTIEHLPHPLREKN
jgi:hypothetical protein